MKETSLRRNEDGYATVFAAFTIIALVIVTCGVVVAGSASATAHKTQSEADLAALAGAKLTIFGADEACAEAARAVTGTLTQCTIEDLDIIVEVRRSISLWRFGEKTTRAGARAGPIQARG